MKNLLITSYQLALQQLAGRGASLLDRGRVSRAFATSRFSSLFARPEPVRNKDHFLESCSYETLREGQASLDDISRDIENCFLSLGNALEKLPDASAAMVRHSEALLALTTGRESGEATFETTVKLLEDPLSFIDGSQAQLEDLVTRLERSNVQIDKLIGSENSLHRAVAPLTHIGTIFKIESAGLDHSVQQMFIALTADIERLHLQVRQTFGEKFVALRGARDTIVTVVAQLRADVDSQGLILREKRRGVEAVLGQLNLDIQKKEERDIQLTNVSRAIDRQVGRLVMSFQTQDIVSQKMAHVKNALAKICEHHVLGLNAAALDTPSDDFAYCATSCGLQGRQLKAVGDELEHAACDISDATQEIKSQMSGHPTAARKTPSQVRASVATSSCLQEANLGVIGADLGKAHGDISDATQEIQKQVAQLDQECLCLNEFDKITAGADGLVQVLLDTIEEVRAMVHKVVATADLAYAAIRPIGGLTSNLTGVMHQLSAQIQLIALNAQVQAAHNCGGTGLEVLASCTATISAETSRLSEHVASGVDQFAIELTSLVESFDHLRQKGSQRREIMEVGARAKEIELHALRDKTLTELMAVGDCVKQINLLVEEMVRENKLQTASGERLDTLRTALAAEAGETERYLERTGVFIDPNHFSEELSKGYSVASEHEVHRAVFQTGPSSLPPATRESLRADLFASLSSIRGDAVMGVTSPHGEPAQAAAARDNSLGDNVDLF